MPNLYEFFAGGGMARAGLGRRWTCRFANDIDPKKASAYRANFGAAGLSVGDIRAVAAADLPGVADLMWGSFPCQDLSLAGARAGLGGARSGTFYPFWDLVGALAGENRAPRLVAMENVCGALASQGGQDFAAICAAFARAGYRCGGLIIDARLFVPQSRPRLFLIGVRSGAPIDPALLSPAPSPPFHTEALRRAANALPPDLGASWLWWTLPAPRRRPKTLAELIVETPEDVAWHAPADTARLLARMSPVNQAKVAAASRSGRRRVGALYKRTRREANGERVQRAEIRFDGFAGCLRTPAGGSSRQTILVIDGATIRSRLLAGREAARLMGLADDYRLPSAYNDAYHLAGDGVVVPVVRHLARHLFEPLLAGAPAARPGSWRSR